MRSMGMASVCTADAFSFRNSINAPGLAPVLLGPRGGHGLCALNFCRFAAWAWDANSLSKSMALVRSYFILFPESCFLGFFCRSISSHRTVRQL